MKKMSTVIALICVTAILSSLFSASAFASDVSLEDLLEKLQTLVTEKTEDEAVMDMPAEDGGHTAKALYDMTAPCVVEITVYDEAGEALASGSGFFINDHGDIVTNYHVIEDACSADVKLMDGDVYEVGYVLAYDPAIDLAVLRIDLTGNDYIPTAKKPAATGDTIYTLGSSLGFTGTFSDGMVSTASREIDGVDYIQITAPISSGNSGGPLINTQGEVLGVNTWEQPEGQNMNFAVNIQELTRLDFSTPLTMRGVYDQEAGHRENVLEFGTDDPQILEWLQDSDFVEAESNDELENADVLPNDYWMAGYIDGIDDFDCYGIILSDPAKVSIVVLPYYSDDNEYILAALVDENGDIISYAEQQEYEETLFEGLEAELEAGVYYLVMCVSDDYPYEEPAYYQVNASWES